MDGIVTQVVFFTAGLVVATLLATSLLGGVGEIAGGIEVHSQAMAGELRSSIRVISDPAFVPNNPLRLLVKNIGAKSLLPEEFTLIVDGAARPGADVAEDVLDEADDRVLPVGRVVQFTISNLNLAAGDHEAKVVADTGVSDIFAFRV